SVPAAVRRPRGRGSDDRRHRQSARSGRYAGRRLRGRGSRPPRRARHLCALGSAAGRPARPGADVHQRHQGRGDRRGFSGGAAARIVGARRELLRSGARFLPGDEQGRGDRRRHVDRRSAGRPGGDEAAQHPAQPARVRGYRHQGARGSRGGPQRRHRRALGRGDRRSHGRVCPGGCDDREIRRGQPRPDARRLRRAPAVGPARPPRVCGVTARVPPNVVLIGFMATGKTSVGRIVAARLGRPFVDTDALIEAQAGRSVPRIFAEDGEAAFRRLEAEAVVRAAAPGGSVSATGGGVVLSRENMDRLRQHGLIIALWADPKAILARVAPGGDRPLLGDDPERRVHRLLEERSEFYRKADFIVETSALSPDAVADRVVGFVLAREDALRGAAISSDPKPPAAGPVGDRPAGGAAHAVRVDLGPRGYNVWIGGGILAEAAAYLDGCGLRGRLALLTHPRIEALYGRPLAGRLRKAGYEVVPVIVPPTESSKSLRVAARVFDRLVDARFDRSCALLALGGGVAGDLGGFVAATFLRGIAWVSAPTTLLAQVDASIGGKTGINFRAKNLIGAVHQPTVVLTDTDSLRSLPPRELRSGMAEVVKTG